MSAIQEIAIDLEADRAVEAGTSQRSSGAIGYLSAKYQGLSIGDKITAFFGVNLIVALIAGALMLLAVIEVSARSDDTTNVYRSAFVAERLVVELSEAQNQSEKLLTATDPAIAAAALSDVNRASQSVAELQGLVSNRPSANSNEVASIGSSLDGLRTALQDGATGVQQVSSGTLARGDVDALIAMNAQARTLAEQLESQANTMAEQSRELIPIILSVWVGFAATLVVLTLMAQRYFNRDVGGELSRLADKMKRLSSGEEIAEIKASNRRDEIGQMTSAVRVLHRAGIRLERFHQERSEKASEELEAKTRLQKQTEDARRERERALRQIANTFEHKVRDVVGKVASASSLLQGTASSMAASAQQASVRTTEVTSSIGNANSGATAAAAASDEFAMSIEEVSRQASSSAALARKASASTQQADTTIVKLSQSAEQVGEIVELIQTIAQRTNLLALNASIEAARGGEAGRGFAVVASEVKELAMQTSRATEQVAQQIREMQDTTGASVSALRSIAREVSELEGVAVSIANAVDEQSYASQDLARSIDMAARGTEEVSEHIKEVQELSTTTGAAAGQVLSSATALDQQAATLRTQVDAFLEEVRSA